ncbi:MAG: GIY-YIG nuclease family protein [Eubacteriales bacterium]
MYYYVYILTNMDNKVLYIGVTSNILRRISEHKNNIHKGFTSKYNVYKLVYYEYTTDIIAAINREKQLKGWIRAKKIQLIENKNPDWRDLSVTEKQ